jgi:hypothetical protein
MLLSTDENTEYKKYKPEAIIYEMMDIGLILKKKFKAHMEAVPIKGITAGLSLL